MKRFLIVIFTIIAMTNPTMGSEQITQLTGKLTQKTLDALVNIYQNPEEVAQPETTKIIEYPDGSKNNENKLEHDAYTTLLPKLVTQIKTDANNYWFKKYDATSFPWYKIVHKAITNKEQTGSANDFMAYLYDLNIKGLNKEQIQNLSAESHIKIENGYYIISGSPFQFEYKFKKTLSFFQKHWGKLAIGAAAIGSAALYKNREDIDFRIKAYRLGGGAWGTSGSTNSVPLPGYFESKSSYAERAVDWLQERTVRLIDRLTEAIESKKTQR